MMISPLSGSFFPSFVPFFRPFLVGWLVGWLVGSLPPSIFVYFCKRKRTVELGSLGLD